MSSAIYVVLRFAQNDKALNDKDLNDKDGAAGIIRNMVTSNHCRLKPS